MPSAMHNATANDCGKAHERNDAKSGDLLVLLSVPPTVFWGWTALLKNGGSATFCRTAFLAVSPCNPRKKEGGKIMSTGKTMNSRVKWLIGSGVLVLATVAVILITQLGGGSANGTGTFSLVVSVDNGAQKLYGETLDIEPDSTLLSVMEKQVPDVVVDNGLITSLCGTQQDEGQGKYWIYTINGEFATVGANEYVPKNGEDIVFDLHAYEK